MKAAAAFALLPFALASATQDPAVTDNAIPGGMRHASPMPQSTDAVLYLNHVFGSDVQAENLGPRATQIASALYPIERAFNQGPRADAREEALFEAAAASPPALASMKESGYNWLDVQNELWYRDNMPAEYQMEVNSFANNLIAAEAAALDRQIRTDSTVTVNGTRSVTTETIPAHTVTSRATVVTEFRVVVEPTTFTRPILHENEGAKAVGTTAAAAALAGLAGAFVFLMV